MAKNGTTSSNTTRWRCTRCGTSDTKRRPDITYAMWFKRFEKHITSKWAITDIAELYKTSPSTVKRYFTPFWYIQIPHTPDPNVVYDQVFLDGTYMAGGCLLIASTDTHVINWRWCKKETKADYMELIRPMAAPLIATIDGGQGAITAIKQLWPETAVQRCIVHAYRNVQRLTTLNPRTTHGKAILGIAQNLLKVKTQDEAKEWMQTLNDFGETYKERLDQKTTYTDAKGHKKQGWKHYRVRRAYYSLLSLCQRKLLFTFLEPPEGVLHPEKLHSTTNVLEGAFNASVKHLAYLHRGRTPERQRTMVDWWLYRKTEAPDDLKTIARQQDWGRPRMAEAKAITQQRKLDTNDDGRPALYDNAIDKEYNHSVGIRQGQL